MRVVKSIKQQEGLYQLKYPKSKNRNRWSLLIVSAFALTILVLAFVLKSPMQPFLVKVALLLLLISIWKTKSI